MYNEAKTEIGFVVDIRNKNGWKLNTQLVDWMNQEWYKNSDAKPNNQELYYQYIHIADEILYQDIPEEIIAVAFVNQHKNMLNFVKDRNKHGFFHYEDLMDTPQVGDILKVRFGDEGDKGLFKVLTVKLVEPTKPTRAIKPFESLLKVVSSQNFGFVDDVFVEPRLINDYNLVDMQTVKGRAMLSYNKKRDEMRWKAFEIEKL
ncbi:MAG: hypothetical protein PHN55_15915 [Dysgonamonadaceae bacterium]|nr:hypothetical protein [Dysgonamonadaceae bacterium]